MPEIFTDSPSHTFIMDFHFTWSNLNFENQNSFFKFIWKSNDNDHILFADSI